MGRIRILSKYYKQLQKKVHPDYFYSEPEKKQLNLENIQHVNALFEGFKATPIKWNSIRKSIPKKLEFWVRGSNPRRERLVVVELDSRSKERVQQSLIELLTNAGVEIESDLASVRTKSVSQTSKPKERFGNVLKNLLGDLDAQLEKESSKLDPRIQRSIERFVYYHPQLTQSQKDVARSKLVELGAIELPILIAYGFHIQDGIFVIPWDASFQEWQDYMDKHQQRVLFQFQQATLD